MAVVQPFGFEIDFARNPISGSAAWFFVIIVKFIFTAIFEIKVHVKKFFGPKKILDNKFQIKNLKGAWSRVPNFEPFKFLEKKCSRITKWLRIFWGKKQPSFSSWF